MGVAISASLLPPAVNCGLLWSVSLAQYIYDEGRVEHSHWSRSLEILASDWWNITMLYAGAKVDAITTQLKECKMVAF